MILHPKTKNEIDHAFQSILRSDADAVLVGNADYVPASSTSIEEAGHTVYFEKYSVTKELKDLQHVRARSAARYEYHRNLLINHPGATMPRSKALNRKHAEVIVAINLPPTE